MPSDSGGACPIASEIRAWIDQRMRWLSAEFGAERLCSAPVVLPTREFFPDPYFGGEDDARRVLDRACGWMGLPPESVQMSLYRDDRLTCEDGWLRRTSGLYQDEGGAYRVWIEVTNLDDLLSLVAICARELGHVLLLGQGRVSVDAEDHEQLADLLTVFFGLGVFSANAVIRERNWQDVNLEGSGLSKRGYLSMPMYGYALARFALLRGEDRPPWAKYLRPDVLAAFKQSLRYLPEPERSDSPITSPSVGGCWPKPAPPIQEDVTAADTAPICKFCGTLLTTLAAATEPPDNSSVAGDDVCAECRASIEENDDDLLDDWQAREARKELGRKIWGWGCLTVVLLGVALSILNSLLR